ncbi:imelysin family protein [Leptospira sarikeiensis]|uniref:Imelysin n=1 Tax=Leptospira sarikeiensis TaxID=2484943 RepID=A0A4R9KBL1_9LEPT|nr:imelysin family protein [Leptospira sarikeiensis]TGL64148.1 imelysin [Leptospira sarikeiensis]
MRRSQSILSGNFKGRFRNKLSLSFVSILLFLSFSSSCSHKNSASAAAGTNGYLYQMFNSFDPRSILQNLGTNTIPPLFANLELSRAALVDATDDVCGGDSLSSAQAAWTNHMSDLKKVEPFRFGASLAHFSRMDPFLINYLVESPPNSDELDFLDSFGGVDVSDAQLYINQIKNKSKGISAIEYLLFSRPGVNRGTSPSCSDFPGSPNRAALVRALVLDYSGHAKSVTDLWDISGTNPYGAQLANAGSGNSAVFPSSGSALDAILSGTVQLLTTMKDGKLEMPGGFSGGGNGSSPKTYRAESRFSGNSFQNLIDNLSTFKAIYTGNGTGVGLSDYVKFYSPALDSEILMEIAELETHLAAIVPASAWGSPNTSAIKASISDLSALLTILNTELAALTGSGPVSGGPGGDGD